VLWHRFILLLTIFILTIVCKNFAQHDLQQVTSWLYQLQNLNFTAAGNTAFDLVVMDYSATGGEDGEYSYEQIRDLKHSPGGEKIVLCYFSIGEAEDYRFYWQNSWDANHDGIPDPGAPDWLDVVDPDWEGNYKVRYWDPDWQAIMFGSDYSYLDRIIKSGFDGVYLDIIDAYWYYFERGRSTAPNEMVDFVSAIAEYARVTKGLTNFLVFPQNAPEILEDADANHRDVYLDTVDGIGAEDVFFYGDEDENNPYNPR